MKITSNWLEHELLTSEFYHGYEIDWFLDQEETDSIKLIEKLLQPEVQEDFDYKYDNDGHYSAALAFANWLLIRTMSNMQLLEYIVKAVELILPVLREDYPEEKTPHNLIALTKAYLQALPKMPLKRKLAYRSLLFELLEFTGKNTGHSQKCSVSWLTYATHLVTYTALYSTFKFLNPENNFPVNCATHAVTFSISYLATKQERNKVYKHIIEDGLNLVDEKFHLYKNKNILEEVNCVN